jgi:hypothetical protein
VLVGFSEYTTYISWVVQNHRDTLDIAQSKEWGRITPKRQSREALLSTECCTTAGMIAQATAKTPWVGTGPQRRLRQGSSLWPPGGQQTSSRHGCRMMAMIDPAPMLYCTLGHSSALNGKW